MTESPTPKTDALREVIIGQYKEDELTGDGMGNILSALTDIETLERERDEWAELWADLSRASVNDNCRLERERDEARKELDALKATIAKSGLIEVEATTCIADKCGKPTIVKNGTMLVHKDEKLRMQQRTVDLQKHAATARKLAAERALADRLADAATAVIDQWDTPNWKLTESTATCMNTLRNALAAWKESRQERNHS